MYWDATFVKPLPDYQIYQDLRKPPRATEGMHWGRCVSPIYVEVLDGRKGVFDMKPYLDRGVFRELKDVHYFNQVGIVFGAVTWPHEQDIAPETLLAELLPGAP